MTSHLRETGTIRSRSAVAFPLRARSIPDRIWVDGDRLYYDWDFSLKDKAPATRVNFDGALLAFKRIRSADGVLRFARRYGPLWICKHDEPYTHNPPARDPSAGRRAGCAPRGMRMLPAWDPVPVWLRYAGEARSILEVAANLHLGKLTERNWQVLTGRPRSMESERDWERTFARRVTGSERLRHARVLLSMRINEWIRIGDVDPTFWWERKPDIGLSGTPFGMIAVQMAAEIAQAPAFAQCDGCGEPYFRKGRSPQAGRRNFCTRCGKKAANRLGQRDFRQKHKED